MYFCKSTSSIWLKVISNFYICLTFVFGCLGISSHLLGRGAKGYRFLLMNYSSVFFYAILRALRISGVVSNPISFYSIYFRILSGSYSLFNLFWGDEFTISLPLSSL